jgi:G:T-mismatch repair DNA endonuclease (very short patch repair protein)
MDDNEWMDIKTDAAVERAVKRVYHDSGNAYRLGKKYSRIMKEYLEPGEIVVLGARQSRLVSLSPSILLATNRKLVFLNPSFWRLHTGHVVFRVSNGQFIPYHTIISVSLARGRYLSSMDIKTLGGGTINVNGLKINEAKLLLSFIEDVIESASSTQYTL